jgi:transglutaminase-like putative cysteine protease
MGTMSLAFYAEQSGVTDPGRMAGWLTDLPSDIAALRRIVSGLVVHYRADDLTALGIPVERVAEIDTRYAERMLERLYALDDRQLTTERPPQQRLVGCCRDFTVLFLTLLRHQGVPARARVGFATYFIPGWNVDHEVAEVWESAAERWQLIDAQLDESHVDETDGVTFDALT